MSDVARPDPIPGILDELTQLSRASPPARFQEVVAATARHFEGTDVAIYLQDFEQRFLHPVHGGEVLPIDGTAAGRAFANDTLVAVETEHGVRLWIPLVNGSERLGMLRVTVPDDTEARRRDCERWAMLVTHELTGQEQYTDLFHLVRRRRSMSLAAEMQWQLLPPLVFSTQELAIAGILEPAYEVGGDTFDYAHNGGTLHAAVIDAMGHGVQASLTSTIAMAAYRHARREGHDLAQTYQGIDAALGEYRPIAFATAILADLDCATGHLQWLNAGHPLPKLLRDGRAHDVLDGDPVLPLGLGHTLGEVGAPTVHELTLQPGDRVLVFTDGAVDARDSEGNPFGEERLVELLLRHAAAGLGLAETVRRLVQSLLTHTGGGLLDDATILLLEYRGRGEAPRASGTGTKVRAG